MLWYLANFRAGLYGFVTFACYIACSQTTSAITLPDTPPELPTDPEQWINSSPLTYEGLREKGIVFWYFEETCPKCAARWPDLLKEVEQFSDLPVLFVAVNSGCDRREIAKYVRDHRIPWPVLVDPDRSFEAASGDVAISLNRIVDVRMLKPDKTYSWGWWNDVPLTVEHAAKGAKWDFKYDRIAEELRPAARRMEFGDFMPAAEAIKIGESSDSQELRRTVVHLRNYIHKQMKENLDAELADSSDENPWQRYQALVRTAQRFAPHELPPSETAELRQLEKAPAVMNETRAQKAIEASSLLLEKGG
ncbi:MAG: redoxin domain-containing protein, partial [Planctomycetales bacterium]|nr:redoxin domain-containing protein [Planctomycetales bacterium]